ncbi:MAG: hypothetical protein JWM10_347 [Myxococcaceae bacterium]|nr:hypothetical protein [Myxococcaceae bacterium]
MNAGSDRHFHGRVHAMLRAAESWSVAERRRLAAAMTARAMGMCVDETFHDGMPLVAQDRTADRGSPSRAGAGRRVGAALPVVQRQRRGPQWLPVIASLWLADRGGSRSDAATLAMLFAREHGPPELREALEVAERAHQAAVAACATVGPQKGRALTTAGALSPDRVLQSQRTAGVKLPATGAVDLELQRYAAPAKPGGRPQPMAPLGALARRVAASRASFARAGALGWIDAGAAVRSYVQAHHVRAEDTAALGATETIALWAAPTRIDDDGRRALRVICRAERGELAVADLTGGDAATVTVWA